MSDHEVPPLPDPKDLMWPGEVAKIFKVDPKTVTRWGKAGKLWMGKTPGGRAVFYRPEIERKMTYRRD